MDLYFFKVWNLWTFYAVASKLVFHQANAILWRNEQSFDWFHTIYGCNGLFEMFDFAQDKINKHAIKIIFFSKAMFYYV